MVHPLSKQSREEREATEKERGIEIETEREEREKCGKEKRGNEKRENKAIAMMRRKPPLSESIYVIEIIKSKKYM